MAQRQERGSRISTRGAEDLVLAARAGRAVLVVQAVPAGARMEVPGASHAVRDFLGGLAPGKDKPVEDKTRRGKARHLRIKLVTCKAGQDKAEAQIRMPQRKTSRGIHAASSPRGEANWVASSLDGEARVADSSNCSSMPATVSPVKRPPPSSKRPRTRLELGARKPEATKARSAKRRHPMLSCSPARSAKGLRMPAARTAFRVGRRLMGAGRAGLGALVVLEDLEAAGAQRRSRARVA